MPKDIVMGFQRAQPAEGPVTILSVTKRAQVGSRILYRIKASDGVTYATTNSLFASACDRAKTCGLQVRIGSSSGWYYRDIFAVKLLESAQEHVS